LVGETLEERSTMSSGTGAVGGCTSATQPAGVPENDFDLGHAIYQWPYSSQLEMAPLPTAVACGRLHAKNVLHEWRLSRAAEDAAILVSELLTNSVNASCLQGSSVRLRLLADHSQLIIEAWDRNPRPPQPRQADYLDEGGRGLNVVAAIADRWGYYRSGNWKVVWAELACNASPLAPNDFKPSG
jgi:anti-sigma regulatory factor (Ser/Thr protein kinase)